MQRRRDPVERAEERSGDGSTDLYDVARWEPRSIVDLFAYTLYNAVSYGFRALVLLVAIAITLALLVSPAAIVIEDPFVGIFFALSVVPAGLLAAYIWYADITTSEPLRLLVATFLLAVLFATFAAVINSLGRSMLGVGAVGSVVFFYLVVGPVEETVKLLAVQVFAYRSESFNAVIDGAVYGAVAGLGFAAIENAIYIGRVVGEAEPEASVLVTAGGIATVRALAGPGHVIYSAIAGYYLGLAKFNRDNAGPIVLKGLLVAAFVHGTYNVTVGIVPELVTQVFPVGFGLAFVGYVIVYDLAIGYYLYRKISRYRRAYRAVRDDADAVRGSELTEFEPPQR
ncbi:PrsW family intramembrane metalloprotease [Natrinema salifodinae]|uniref:Membrane proteinase PrsW, cleaves anti-sigma factor RsiW, M82 family n=1 Tax=Natrinema salifodinae TaxID=1202768 RepID=A0A1I0PPY2_9EURY|nr:PrsW family intramembrane metalloprotease [Natrinema salifodinae]SEW16321.1 Membrane proteinase PrsW, cleaves anti-sigma factor RsiW, M82 family [Natrinema salifodinae]